MNLVNKFQGLSMGMKITVIMVGVFAIMLILTEIDI